MDRRRGGRGGAGILTVAAARNQTPRIDAAYVAERAALDLCLQCHDARVEAEYVPRHHVDAVGDTRVAELRCLFHRGGERLLHPRVPAPLEKWERDCESIVFVGHDADDVEISLTRECLRRDVCRCYGEISGNV